MEKIIILSVENFNCHDINDNSNLVIFSGVCEFFFLYFKMSNLPFLKFEFLHFKSKKCQIWAELFFKIVKT